MMNELNSIGCASVLSDSGPGLDIQSPDLTKACAPPVCIRIRFLPRDGRSVDLSRLKIELIKFITIDLTPKVLPYVSGDGIHMDQVDLPSGSHKLKITVADTAGGITQVLFAVRVA